MMEPMLSYLVKSFKLRSRELTVDEAVKAAAGMQQFHAVELHYKGNPVRLIVASSTPMPEKLFDSLNEKRAIAGSPSDSVVEKG
jgi:hypothetical protein